MALWLDAICISLLCNCDMCNDSKVESNLIKNYVLDILKAESGIFRLNLFKFDYL